MRRLSERRKRWIERTVANDRSNKLIAYNRFYSFALLVLLQLAGMGFLLFLFAYNSKVGVAVQLVVSALALVCVLYVINKNDRLSGKLNWVLIILIFPVFGVPLYLLGGEGRPARRLKKKLDKSKEENRQELSALLGGREEELPARRKDGVSYYLSRQAGYPAFTEGELVYYDSGEKIFPEMRRAIASAKKYILVEYFIIAHGKMWGEIVKLLLEKAAAGVQVRIIYDDFGSITTLPPSYDRYLESLHENIRAMAFNEVVPIFDLRMNNRDHRKMLVVDGEIAFTGGINLADEYIGEKLRFGYWKDSGIKLTGRGAFSFTVMFFDIWNAFRKDKESLESYLPEGFDADLPPSNKQSGGIIHPYDDSPLDKRCVAERVYVDILDRAVKYAYIFTPYLLPDDAIRTAMIRAAERGVDVRIVTPGIPDKKMIYRLTRANYAPLLAAGVRIYEYTPGFIHSKSIVSDDECAVVGTINFDCRSLYLHFENAVYFSDLDAVLEVKRDCEETFALSFERTEENSKRGFVGRFVDSVLRVFESLM